MIAAELLLIVLVTAVPFAVAVPLLALSLAALLVFAAGASSAALLLRGRRRSTSHVLLGQGLGSACKLAALAIIYFVERHSDSLLPTMGFALASLLLQWVWTTWRFAVSSSVTSE